VSCRNGASLASAATDNEARKNAPEAGPAKSSKPASNKPQASWRALRKPSAPAPSPLDLLFERATTLASRARDGSLSFIEAVDMAYSAADLSGLVERYGDDVVQVILADAFTGARP
jgi:hypothetical protein